MKLSNGLNVEASLNGDEVTLRVDGNEALRGRLALLEAGDGWLEVDGRLHRFYVQRQRGGKADIWIDGKVYHIEKELRAAAASAAGPAGDLLAPMPGTVLKILVAVGDRIEAGQPLLVLESMKMEMTLSASGAGQVERVSCQAGDMVEMGATLIHVAAASA